MLVVDDKTPELLRATNNMQQVLLVRANYLSVYYILNADQIVMTPAALKVVESWLRRRQIMKLTLVTPRATEKAYRLITVQNTYIFDVPLDANKQEIKDAVEAQFDDKSSERYDTGSKWQIYPFQPWQTSLSWYDDSSRHKKAYVTLSEGKIKVFDTDEKKEEKK